MQVEHRAHVVLLLVQHFLLIGVAQERQHQALHAHGGLHAVGDELLVGHRIHVLHGLAGVLLMLLEVIVGAVGNAPQLAPAEGEQVLKVGGRLGVEG